MTAHLPTPRPAAQTQAASPTEWAQHLLSPAAGEHRQAALSPAEAARVQRHRDQLMAALQAQDRRALRCAKQEVLTEAFCQGNAQRGAAAPGSPALRSALRALSWRMAGCLLPRSTPLTHRKI